MRRAFDLLELLADRAEHSGAELAEQLGITRAAVWNHVKRLRDEGVEIQATPGQGYVLPGGYEALSGPKIEAALRQQACFAFNHITTLAVTDSTNERLLVKHGDEDIHAHVVMAEYQTAGRGRRGDRWMSPPGSGLCFSLAWRFDAPPSTFSALSLVVGVALVTSLHKLGVTDAQLKWPNDIVRGPRKMAGILIEMRSEASGPSLTVIGIGLNVSLSSQARALIDRPSDDFHSASGQATSRHDIAVSVLAELARCLETFALSGFAPFRPTWLQHDALADADITLDMGTKKIRGIARGVDEQGALIIEHDGRRERYLSGHLIVH